jgi:hypothetical protein
MGDQLLPLPLTGRSVHLCVGHAADFFCRRSLADAMDRVLPVAAALANRHPERTVFTRFIPPERPDQMPGMSRRYYTRWRVATRDYLDLFMIALPLMATFFALSFRPFARRHSQAFIIAFGLVGMACTYINVYLFAVDSPFRIDNGNATMNAMLMLGFLALLPLSVSSTIVLGSIVVAGHAGVVMETGMLLWTSWLFYLHVGSMFTVACCIAVLARALLSNRIHGRVQLVPLLRKLDSPC